MSNDDPKLTELLNRWFRGDRTVEEELWPYLVGELWVIAKSLLKLERPDHTLQATELVNELYLKTTSLDRAEHEKKRPVYERIPELKEIGKYLVNQ